MQSHEIFMENCFPTLPSNHPLCYPKRIQIFKLKIVCLHFSSFSWIVYIQCQNQERLIKATERKDITMEVAQYS